MTVAYNPEAQAKRVEDARKYVRSIKVLNPCADCGMHYHFAAMDFDHVRGEKKADISTLVTRGARIVRIKAEIDLCELVCSNCHRIRTFKRLTRG